MVNKFQQEIDISSNKVFRTKYGTFDSGIPNVLYISVKVRFMPINNQKSYNSEIQNVKSVFDDYVKEFFQENKTFSDEYLFSLFLSDNNPSFGKKSNARYEVLVKPKEKRTFDNHTDIMRDLSNTFSNKLSDVMLQNGFQVC